MGSQTQSESGSQTSQLSIMFKTGFSKRIQGVSLFVFYMFLDLGVFVCINAFYLFSSCLGTLGYLYV